MAAPFVPLLIAGGGYLLGRLGQSALGPVGRSGTYAGNTLLTNSIPEPNQLINLYQFGSLSFDWYQRLMKAHGCEVNSGVKTAKHYRIEQGMLQTESWPGNANRTAWEMVANLSDWVPSEQMLLQMILRGILTKDTVAWFARRLGIHDAEVFATFSSLSRVIPPVQDLIRMQIREVFNVQLRKDLKLDEEFDQSPEFAFWASRQGLGPISLPDGQGGFVNRDFARDYWAAHWAQPSPTAAYTMFQRLRPERIAKLEQFIPGVKAFTIDDLKRLLKVQDYSPEWRERLAAISYRIINRVDVRRMLATGTINQPEATSVYQDMGYNPEDAARLTDFAMKTVFWKPSVTQVGKLYHAGVIPQAEAKELLSSRFVKPEHFNIIEQQTEFVPSVQTAIRWLRKNYIKSDRFKQILQRNGVKGEFAEYYEREALSKPANAATQLTIGKIKEAYETGYINRDTAKMQLVQLGLQSLEVDQAIQTIDLEIKIRFVKKAINGIHRQFIDGVMDRFQSGAALTGLGVNQDRIQDYLNTWEVELFTHRRQISAQKVIDAFVRGLIPADEMKRRIENLGYVKNDVDLFVQFGMQNLQIAIARAAAQAAKTQAQRIREQERLVERLERAKRQAWADLARHGTPDKLKKWYKQKLITEVQVVTRLRALGWPDDDITRLLNELG